MRAITLLGVIVIIILFIYFNTDALDFLTPYFEKIGIGKPAKSTGTAATSTETTVTEGNGGGTTEEVIIREETQTGMAKDVPGVLLPSVTRPTTPVNNARTIPELVELVRVFNANSINYWGPNMDPVEEATSPVRIFRFYFNPTEDALAYGLPIIYSQELEIIDDTNVLPSGKGLALESIVWQDFDFQQNLKFRTGRYFVQDTITAQTIENIYRYVFPEGKDGPTRTLPELYRFLGFEEVSPGRFLYPFEMVEQGSGGRFVRIYETPYYSVDPFNDAIPYLG